MRAPWVFAFLHGCVAVRIADEEALKARAVSASGSCESAEKVKEDADGFCVDAASGADLFFYCCNILRSCRQNSNIIYDYYTNALTIYEEDCGVVDADFRLSRDGQRLTLIDPSETGKPCQPACLVSRRLQERQPIDVAVSQIIEDCSGSVHEDEWKPQLDGAAWPIEKVIELDASWIACGGSREDPTTPAPTPAPVTTSTTTITFTAEEPAFEQVSFEFLGTDTVYQGHQKTGFWVWANRATRNERDEVLRNHKCASRGSRDQTYYASSLCYWVPDVPTAQRSDDGMGIGLEWTGSLLHTDERMCTAGFTQKGKCMKCSVCHNNARNMEGKVTFVTWPEEIALSSDCLKETDVERNCDRDFQITQRPLIDRVDVCTEAEAEHDSAVSLHERALALLEALPRLIETEIPLRIDTLETERLRLRTEHLQAQIRDDSIMRNDVESGCVDMIEHPLNPGYPIWWQAWNYGWPTAWILGNMTFAVPDRPSRDVPGWQDRQIYRDAVVSCDAARTLLRDSYAQTSVLQQEKDYVTGLKEEAEQELLDRQAQLAQVELEEPVLRQRREEQEALWNPQKEQCYADYDEMARIRPQEMRRCIPSYYDRSCEKECVEIQKNRPGGEGCGIIEGHLPQDPTSRGGIRSVCRPPVASWIKGPTTWAADEEPAYRQCQRTFLEGEQYGRHAQRVLIRGMLEKRSRWNQWQDRYFILESGDEVRSAVLRYWYEDPSVDRQVPERVEKAIILWDAKRVTSSGSFCWNLVHFYRTYKMCVLDRSTTTRNQWVQHIRDSIRYPS